MQRDTHAARCCTVCAGHIKPGQWVQLTLLGWTHRQCGEEVPYDNQQLVDLLKVGGEDS